MKFKLGIGKKKPLSVRFDKNEVKTIEQAKRKLKEMKILDVPIKIKSDDNFIYIKFRGTNEFQRKMFNTVSKRGTKIIKGLLKEINLSEEIFT